MKLIKFRKVLTAIDKGGDHFNGLNLLLWHFFRPSKRDAMLKALEDGMSHRFAYERAKDPKYVEEFVYDDIIYTPLVPTQLKVEVLDPCGVVTETHEITYKAAYYAGRFILTIGEYHWMVIGNGKNVRRIDPEPEILK